MYKFAYKISDIHSKKKFVNINNLDDVKNKILNIPGIVLSCSYFKHENGIDIYVIRNVYGGNEIVGYCTGNIQ